MVTCETAAFSATAASRASSMVPPNARRPWRICTSCCRPAPLLRTARMRIDDRSKPKADWTLPEVRALHDLPLMDLVYRAQTVHREHFGDNKVQLCSLLSVKTGGCPEDCAYCPQAARYHTGVEAQPLLELDEVLAAAGKAREAGATRFCMGAAWRGGKEGPQFDRVLEMVRGVKELGIEACCTLGM